jgi:hypothetical protein
MKKGEKMNKFLLMLLALPVFNVGSIFCAAEGYEGPSSRKLYLTEEVDKIMHYGGDPMGLSLPTGEKREDIVGALRTAQTNLENYLKINRSKLDQFRYKNSKTALTLLIEITDKLENLTNLLVNNVIGFERERTDRGPKATDDPFAYNEKLIKDIKDKIKTAMSEYQKAKLRSALPLILETLQDAENICKRLERWNRNLKRAVSNLEVE